MKHIQRITFSLLLYLMSLSVNAQNFYDLQLSDIDKNTVRLQSLRDKKIMAIVLPPTAVGQGHQYKHRKVTETMQKEIEQIKKTFNLK